MINGDQNLFRSMFVLSTTKLLKIVLTIYPYNFLSLSLMVTVAVLWRGATV